MNLSCQKNPKKYRFFALPPFIARYIWYISSFQTIIFWVDKISQICCLVVCYSERSHSRKALQPRHLRPPQFLVKVSWFCDLFKEVKINTMKTTSRPCLFATFRERKPLGNELGERNKEEELGILVVGYGGTTPLLKSRRFHFEWKWTLSACTTPPFHPTDCLIIKNRKLSELDQVHLACWTQ